MHGIRILQYGTGEAPRWLYFHLDETPGSIPIGMYCWLIEGSGGPILVDVGANESDTRARYGDRYNFADWEDPVDVVSRHVAPESVETIIITHVHWDHLSPSIESYPNARVILQRRDLEARTKPLHPSFRELCFAEYLDGLSERLGDRLVLVDGDTDVAPGVRTILVGGHTVGSQAVLVDTSEGTSCITGDLVPAYENLTDDLATSLHEDYLGCFSGMAKIRSEADLIIPGHDRHVLYEHPGRIVG